MAKVAFLGLGVMGYPMAGHLKNKGGHDVTVYNRNPAKSKQWVEEHGGRAQPTPKAAADGQDFVMMCVGNDNDVRAVARGENGALAGKSAGAVLIDHTTASAAVAREIAGKSPEAIRACKRMLNNLSVDPGPALLAESVEQMKLMGGPNQLEAVSANIAKRAPRFEDVG